MATPRIRPPSGLKPSVSAPAGSNAGAQLLSDRDTTREIVASLDRLEALVKRLGRFTLSGDDTVDIALEGLEKAGGPDHAPLRPVGLILKRRDGQAHAVPPERIVPLLRRIRDGWRPARKAPMQSSAPAPPA